MQTIHNARTTLFATALNNLGVGAMLAGIIAPLVNGAVGDAAHILAWLVLGIDLIGMAPLVLGRLRT